VWRVPVDLTFPWHGRVGGVGELDMAENRIRVRDFTSLTEPSDSVVLVHFEEVGGIIHVYRDGTVVLTSPFGTTVASLKYPGDQLWRKEVFTSTGSVQV